MRDKYQRYQAVLRAMVRYGRVLFTVARCSAASTLHHGRPVARRSARLAFRSAQVMYRQVARRPHDHLVRRWRWYARWHGWSYHKHIHAAILGVYMFTVGAVVLGVYRQTQALSDLTDTWDFTNASQFSMDSGVEVSGSSARLKAQNYAADSNTMALYHFDELGGSTAADSSGNGNNGTVSNAAFGAGNLNNALSLNGTTSRVTVPDSTSLALTGQNSIEAWTKFNSNFTAGSAAQREPIVDKGDYQLYYDNETGKLTYELADMYGQVPLPPYMHRDATPLDAERYQTVWAKEKGSVAAPTASLNMTDTILDSLRAKGVQIAYLTLHVGLGTFMPIRTDRLEDHHMHQEYFEIPAPTVVADTGNYRIHGAGRPGGGILSRPPRRAHQPYRRSAPRIDPRRQGRPGLHPLAALLRA